MLVWLSHDPLLTTALGVLHHHHAGGRVWCQLFVVFPKNVEIGKTKTHGYSQMCQTRSTLLAGMEAELFHESVLTMSMEFRGSELNESVQEPVHRGAVRKWP